MTIVSKRMLQSCLVLISLSLVILSFPFSAVKAGDVAWSVVPLPVEGEAGSWVLANGADVKCLTAAKDGTLYCYATPSGTTERLFKSTNSGRGWASVGNVQDTITSIAVHPSDTNTIYYATALNVYKSSDAGNVFTCLPAPGGSRVGGSKQITSLTVTGSGEGSVVAIGVTDWVKGLFGGVYLFDENMPVPTWSDTAIGNYDVYQVAFSTSDPGSQALVALTSNESDVVIKTRIGGGAWSQAVGDAVLHGVSIRSAAIAFPSDYSPLAGFFFALDSGANQGGIFKITPAIAPLPSIVTPLGGQELSGKDITSLAISGQTLIAGCARESATYTSVDGGTRWMRTQAAPSGQSDTFVVAAPDFQHSQTAYLVTSGSGSAFSVSTDAGIGWRQTSLVDGKISNLVDFSCNHSGTDPVLFLVTFDSIGLEHSLWRSFDSGVHWERTFSGGTVGIDTFNMVKGTADGGLFLAGQSRGIPVFWFSYDLGKTFVMRLAPCAVESWTFLDRNNFCIGGYNSSKGVVYRTENGGISFSQASNIGTRSICSIAFSPDFSTDRIVAAGNTGGQVYLSMEGGNSYSQIGQQLPVTAGTGKVKLAFDANFKNNRIIYASVDTKTTASSRERIFKFTVGQSTAWQSIYSSLPEDAVIGQILVTEDGNLYTVNGQGASASTGKGGLLRALNPAQSGFELITGGLDDGVILNGLWAYRNQLYSIDTKYNRLMTLTDTLSPPVVLESPDDKSSGTATDMRLEWRAVPGATNYEWQINDEDSFSNLPAGFSGLTLASAARLNLAPSTTYHWRVRAVSPVHSPWSQTRSFSTLVGGENDVPVLTLPQAGSVTGIKPVFLWQTVPSADRYELAVSSETAFISPVISLCSSQSIPTNAWQCDLSLEYDTTYFWKVRACTATNTGVWSPVSAFTTEKAAVQEVPDLSTASQPERGPDAETIIPSSQPDTVVQFQIPDRFMLVGIVLLVLIGLLVVLMVVLLLRRRL
jgi:hypothetical protein